MRDITESNTAPHPQICTLKSEPEQDRFRFTPVKRAPNAAPRVWDRKPSTSFLAQQSRPRKVWKRFRTSFNSMKALQQMIAADKQPEEEGDELDMEINSSRNAGLLVRGVKRQCLNAVESDKGGGTAGSDSVRGRSFLETKWESEMGRRKRKFPTKDAFLDPMDVDGSQLESDSLETGQHSSTSELEMDARDSVEKGESVDIELDVAYPEPLHGTSSCLQSGNDDSDSSIKNLDELANAPIEENVGDEVADAPTNNKQPEVSGKDTVPAQEIVSAEQESTLVRSALRSSLDGEDAQLLNNFLSKAKAKRAAKAAMAGAEEEEKLLQEEEVVPDIHTPRSRRALQELDANSPSPSPQKAQVLSPRKADGPPNSPLRKDIANEDGDEQQEQPSSPATRRSTRRVPPRTTTIPGIRNTLSLRRAKGTEFVFLQRTEAQELALATRKNTRQNKGPAILPKYTLKALARKPESNEGSPGPGDSSPSCRVTGGNAGKRVCWNDARLVEFEDGEKPQASPTGRPESSDDSDGSALPNRKGGDKSKTATTRSTRSQRVKGDDKSTASTETSANTSTTASATATPPPTRRVRRLASNSTAPIKADPVSSPSSSSSSSSNGAGTPTGRRKKLTPKSPSTNLLASPASKKDIASSSTGTATATATKASANKLSKAGGTSTSVNSGTKSKSSIFKANAGSTPMPKRVRSRT